MPFFTGGPDVLPAVQKEGLAGQQTSWGDAFRASIESGIHEMPITRIAGAIDHAVKGTEGDMLSPEDANAKYGIKGVLNFDKPVSSRLASTLNEEKQNDILRDNTIRNGAGGVIGHTVNAFAGAVPSFLDPINYAATMVPGLGEARISAGLGRLAAGLEDVGLTGAADGALGAEAANRAAGRVIESNPFAQAANAAGQGAMGQAALEPLNMYLDRDEHNDWSAGQALGNIAFGGIMGAGLHSLGSLLGKRLTAAGPDARGQVLGESIASLGDDRPSNAENMLHIHEAQNTSNDLDNAMEAQSNAPAPQSPEQMRDDLQTDLASLQQDHAHSVQESATFERPAAEAPAPTLKAAPAQKQPLSLFSFLTKHGGVMDEGGELKANDINRQRIALVRKKGGMALDDARRLAEEHGYLKSGSEINDLLDAMTEEGHGRKIYPHGITPQANVHDAALEEHHRTLADRDAEDAAQQANISLQPDEFHYASEAILRGAHPDDALEEALRVSRHSTWERYSDMLDTGRNIQQRRLGAKQEFLHTLTRAKLGRYAAHMDADFDRLDLHDMASAIMESEHPAQAIEDALHTIEAKRDTGFNLHEQEDVQAAYLAAKQRLNDLQEDAAGHILRNLKGPEPRDVTEARSGNTIRREQAPEPTRTDTMAYTPLPTNGIDHLDLSEVGGNPALVGHMPEGVEGAPAWPVILGDGEHKPILDRKGRETGNYGGHGRTHILAGHQADMEKAGFDNVNDYVRFILENADSIRQSKPRNGKGDGAYFVVHMGQDTASNSTHNTAVLHLIRKDGYYRVATAGKFFKEYLERRESLLDGGRLPSHPNGRMTEPTDSMATKADNHARNNAARRSDSPTVETASPKSQDESFSEAQDYSQRIDRQIAALGDTMWRLDDPEAGAPTGNKQAEAAAGILSKALDDVRLAQNKQGAWIGKAEHYVTRQSHDMWKIREAGYEAWRDAVLPALDDKTFDMMDAKQTKEGFLKGVWLNLSSGYHDNANGKDWLSGFKGTGNKAKQVSQNRVLIFKDADGWLAYNKKFGQGHIVDSIFKSLMNGARNTAVMQELGTNPENMFRSLIEEAKESARDRADHAMVDKLKKLENGYLLDTITGRAQQPANKKIATIGQYARALNQVTKLGGVVISSFADLAVNASVLRHNGVPYLESYWNGFKSMVPGLKGEGRKEIAQYLGVGIQGHLGSVMNRFSASDAPLGQMSRLVNGFYKWNLLQAWTDSHSEGVGLMLSHNLGRNADMAFEALDRRLQRNLRRFAIEAPEWEAIRHGVLTTEDGIAHILPREMDKLSDEVVAHLVGKGQDADDARSLLSQKLYSYITDQTREGMTEPDARTSAGFQAFYNKMDDINPWLGQAARAMAQFKSFTVTHVRRSYAREVQRFGPDVPGIVHLITASTLMGYVSMQCKALISGRDPRDPSDVRTWMAALQQGGGAGIYGDFLFGQQSRMGNSFLETLAGPTFGDLAKLYHIAADTRDELIGSSDAEKASAYLADMVRFASGEIPLGNLPFVNLAIKQLIIYRLQDMINPGYSRRYEQLLERNQGQGFWLHPSYNPYGN